MCESECLLLLGMLDYDMLNLIQTCILQVYTQYIKQRKKRHFWKFNCKSAQSVRFYIQCIYLYVCILCLHMTHRTALSSLARSLACTQYMYDSIESCDFFLYFDYFIITKCVDNFYMRLFVSPLLNIAIIMCVHMTHSVFS